MGKNYDPRLLSEKDILIQALPLLFAGLLFEDLNVCSFIFAPEIYYSRVLVFAEFFKNVTPAN